MAEIRWEAVAREAVHPLRVAIMEHAAAEPEARFSAKQLADEWEEKLGNVSYHVRALQGQGLLERAGQRAGRGALQRFCRAGPKLLVQ